MVDSQNAQNKNCSEKKIEKKGLAIEALLRIDNGDGLVEDTVDPRLSLHILVSQTDDKAELTLSEGLAGCKHELKGALALRLNNFVVLEVSEL